MIEKYYKLKDTCSIKLHKLVESKGYNIQNVWEDEYRDDWFEIPAEIVFDNFSYERYTIVKWEDNKFVGLSWDTNDPYYFDIEDLNLETICNLYDYIKQLDNEI